jgi:hypothetical protein
MRLPGFDAESGLYKTRGFYCVSVAPHQANGVTPQQFPLQLPSGTPAIGPFPHLLCEPCLLDPVLGCAKECVSCPGPIPDERCTPLKLPCPESECCPPGESPCYLSGASKSCCPPGQSCCNPETNFCCPQGEICCDPKTEFCCPSGHTCCCNPEKDFCCPPGQLCCDPESNLCLDVQTDILNCGACGNVCPVPVNATSTCTSGVCRFVCDPGFTKCGNACVNLTGDTHNCGTCGNVCGQGAACVNGQCVCPSAGILTSFNNVILYDGSCNGIQNLKVSLKVTQDMVATVTPFGGGTPTSDGGFTMQLNAFNPSGQGTSWMQYIFLITGNAINAQVQYWNIAAYNNCVNNCDQNCANQGGNVGQCQNNCPGNCVTSQTQTVNLSKHILDLSSNTIPAGYVFEVDLNSDGKNNITGGTFKVTDNQGNPTSQQFQVDANHQFPIVAFQVNVVGPDNLSNSAFTSGAGTITYESSGQLCVEGGIPDTCSGSGTTTGESSNATYGTIAPPCCGSQLGQSLST